MLEAHHRVIIYAEAAMNHQSSKVAEGILRYSKSTVVAVIDSRHAGKRVNAVTDMDLQTPIVATLEEAAVLGADVMVLGTAPSGGRLPPEWNAVVDAALARGLSIVNGLHDALLPRFAAKLGEGQWISDIRTPVGDFPPIAAARASKLNNIRCAMVGTDMGVGKKSAGIEVCRALVAMGADAEFLATGQTGICITGRGIPVDAFRVDHAAGAVERLVLENGQHDYLIVEGQGSLLHPGSTAVLPLIRGSCCNAMMLCHRAGMQKLDFVADVPIPPLPDVVKLYEAVASAAGALTRAKVVGIALITRGMSDSDSRDAIKALETETGLPVQDPVRFGGFRLAAALMALHEKP